MCCKNHFKKLLSFGLTFLLGLLVASIFQVIDSYNKAEELLSNRNDVIEIQEKPIFKNSYPEQGRGSAACSHRNLPELTNTDTVEPLDPRNKRLFILSKPRPLYTEQARANNTQGSVELRITFLASGEIGKIEPISELPDGLTEQAIAAAKQMRFEPATKNGSPVTVIKSVQFNFTIY